MLPESKCIISSTDERTPMNSAFSSPFCYPSTDWEFGGVHGIEIPAARGYYTVIYTSCQ